MARIDTQQFLKDLNDLRKIGAYKTGVHRPTYSPQDMESRHWLVEKLAACGLKASIDGIGNVYGRHKGPGPHLLVGSHIESQNQAGWLDGALGVVAGVALAPWLLPGDPELLGRRLLGACLLAYGAVGLLGWRPRPPSAAARSAAVM